MAHLASLEPMKVEVVEYLLPALLRIKNDDENLSHVVSGILLTLGFTDSDINRVGGDGGVIAEWFFMER